jgi:Flp pilus assembly protein TadG
MFAFNRGAAAGLLTRIRDERGATTLEFAMVCPAFLALLFGISFAGLMFFDQSTLQQAVEHSARDFALNQTMTQSQISTDVSGYLSSIGAPPITVTYSKSTVSGVNVGHISASMSESYNVPLINNFTMTLTADSYVPLTS